MSVLDVAAWGLTWAGGLLLVLSGAMHQRDTRLVRAVLDAQGVLPPRARPAVTRLLGPGELTAGVLVLVSPLLGPVSRLGPVVAAAVYLALAVYVVRLLVTRPGVTCGCFGSDEPAVPTTALRAFLLATGAGVAALTRSPAAPAEGAIAAGVGSVLAVMLFVLPQLEDLLRGPRP